MAVEGLAVFLVVKDGLTGSVYRRFHNAYGQNVDGSIKTIHTTSLIEGKSRSYSYMPFIYQGGTQNRNGDNSTAALDLAPNQISMAFATEITSMTFGAETSKPPDIVRAVVVRMDPKTWQPESNGILTDETWVAAGMSYTAEVLEIILSSAIDAVNALAPTYSLNTVNVGQVPVTSSVRT